MLERIEKMDADIARLSVVIEELPAPCEEQLRGGVDAGLGLAAARMPWP